MKCNVSNKFYKNSKITNEEILSYANYLHDFCKKYIKKSKTKGVVIGLSGGIDSSTSLAILTSKKDIDVTGVCINIESDIVDWTNVKLLKNKFNFNLLKFNLTKIYHDLVKILKIDKNHLAKINLKVRLRTTVLYAIAQMKKQLVVGNSNYDELVTGFFTKFGDNACDIFLLTGLVKRQIKKIAKMFGVPNSIIERKPTAGLYPNQTDESELKITYDEIDNYLLFGKVSLQSEKIINNRIKNNAHKNKLPIKPKSLSQLRYSSYFISKK